MGRRILMVLVGAMALTAAPDTRAGEIGHFGGGLMNIRDYVVPEPGWYAAVYNYFYTTDRINNSEGGKQSSATIPAPGGGAGIVLGVNVNVDMYVLAPTFI